MCVLSISCLGACEYKTHSKAKTIPGLQLKAPASPACWCRTPLFVLQCCPKESSVELVPNLVDPSSLSNEGCTDDYPHTMITKTSKTYRSDWLPGSKRVPGSHRFCTSPKPSFQTPVQYDKWAVNIADDGCLLGLYCNFRCFFACIPTWPYFFHGSTINTMRKFDRVPCSRSRKRVPIKKLENSPSSPGPLCSLCNPVWSSGVAHPKQCRWQASQSEGSMLSEVCSEIGI